MAFGFILAQVWLFSAAVGIDTNEKVGPCIPGFDVSKGPYLTAHEGVWFPQYRARQRQNKRFSCHTLNEHLGLVDNKLSIDVDSWFTKDNVPLKDAYTQQYIQRKWGVLIDEEELRGHGTYELRNFIINLTPEYRVRYLCTNLDEGNPLWKNRIHLAWMSLGRKDGPVVYIETRNMTPSIEVISKAVADLKKAGLPVVLEKIVQTGCTRPLTPDGYPDPADYAR